MNSSATAVSLREKFGQFTEHWSPKKIAALNDYEIKIVKIKGEFVWHSHTDTDEMFLVTKGQIRIQLRNGDVPLGPGELFVVPRGVEHCPIAEEEGGGDVDRTRRRGEYRERRRAANCSARGLFVVTGSSNPGDWYATAGPFPISRASPRESADGARPRAASIARTRR